MSIWWSSSQHFPNLPYAPRISLIWLESHSAPSALVPFLFPFPHFAVLLNPVIKLAVALPGRWPLCQSVPVPESPWGQRQANSPEGNDTFQLHFTKCIRDNSTSKAFINRKEILEAIAEDMKRRISAHLGEAVAPSKAMELVVFLDDRRLLLLSFWLQLTKTLITFPFHSLIIIHSSLSFIALLLHLAFLRKKHNWFGGILKNGKNTYEFVQIFFVRFSLSFRFKG